MAKAKKNENHYVDNKEFYAEMVKWKKECNKAQKKGNPNPPATDYIGECFLKIAEGVAKKPNFAGYTYIEDMIGDGIENCILYAANFDPDKSKNPFAYFTQIIYFAFLRRISKEKKQAILKYQLYEQHIATGTVADEFNTEGEAEKRLKLFNLTPKDVGDFSNDDSPSTKKKRRKKKKTNKGTLRGFIDDE
jgi:DNA-directed RNA polymerase specialized sigma subunit